MINGGTGKSKKSKKMKIISLQDLNKLIPKAKDGNCHELHYTIESRKLKNVLGFESTLKSN